MEFVIHLTILGSPKWTISGDITLLRVNCELMEKFIKNHKYKMILNSVLMNCLLIHKNYTTHLKILYNCYYIHLLILFL